MHSNNWDLAYKKGNDFQAISTTDFEEVLSHISYNEDGNHSALDIGCGTGQLSREVLHRGYRVLGVDLSKTAISRAKKSTRMPTDKLQFLVSNFQSSAYDTHPFYPFNLVVCKYVYPFIGDKESFLEKARSLLDEQGSFVIINPDIDGLPRHRKHISLPHEDVLAALEKFFKVKSYERTGDMYYICTTSD